MLFRSTFFRYSPTFYHFSVLIQIRPFLGTCTNSTIFWYLHGHFFYGRTDSTFSRYLPRFYHFPVLTLILPFSDTRLDSFSVLARIQPFPGNRPNSTILRYSHRFDPFPVLVGKFFDTCKDSTFSRYSPGFCHFSILTQI